MQHTNLPLKLRYALSITLAMWLLGSMPALCQSQTIDWHRMGENKHATFYEVQRQFYQEMSATHADEHDQDADKEEQEIPGVEIFKRWEAYMTPRVYPTGDMSLPSTNYAHYMSWQAAMRSVRSGGAGNWTSLGPVGSPTGPSPYSRTGAGRVNFVRFSPSNTNTMYVGTPDGGLWKSTNAGATWTTNTDLLSIIGCADIAINPHGNGDTMYLATGDIEGDRRSIGVLKSTDGGTTWSTTSLVWTAADNKKIAKLLMDPTNPLNMIICTNEGTFRTTDGWASNQVGTFPGGVLPALKDMKFNPSNPRTIYVSGDNMWKSTDAGVTWSAITSGLPATGVSRIAIGVTPANPGYVYALVGQTLKQMYMGMYLSTDSGTTFILKSDTPNLLGYHTDGRDSGGQAFYDLSIAVSPTLANTVTTGGVNHWQSIDGGVHWSNLSFWAAGQVHADIHELVYLPGSSTTLFSCNDGGIFKSIDNGATWTDISNNLSIAQVVGMGLSAINANTIVAGEQDNGTNLRTGTSWNNINGGDGGQCFIDYTNDSTIYIQYVQGAFSRSDDSGANNHAITTGLPTGFDFYSPWLQDPMIPTKLFVGGTATLYASRDKGDNWFALGKPPGSGSIIAFAIAPSNNAIVYCVKEDTISKSIDSGATFTSISGTLPNTASFSNVTVSNTNPNKVWITYSGYSATDKVYKSVNGGTVWTNRSTGLPNIPVNTVLYEKNSALDAVYIGADIGVYYLDSTMTSPIPFMNGLPNNAVRDLKIFHATGKIRAATYGRGIWESSIYSATPCVPTSSTTAINICPSQLPYKGLGHNMAAAGTDTIHSTNIKGCDSAAIVILTLKSTSTSTTPISVCVNQLPYTGLGHNIAAAGADTLHLTNSKGCDSSAIVVLTVNPLPTVSWKPTVKSLDWCGSNVYLILSGGTPAGGSYSGQYVAGDTLYNNHVAGQVTVTYRYLDAHLCANTDSTKFTLSICTDIGTTGANNHFIIYPNPASNHITVSTDGNANTLSLCDILGRKVVTIPLTEASTEIDLSAMSKGVYIAKLYNGTNVSTQKLIVE